MRKKGSTSYEEAKKKATELFEQGLNAEDVYRALKNQFKENEMPANVRSLYRWLDEWRKKSQFKETFKIMASDKMPQATDVQEQVQDWVPARKAGLALVKPPSLDELIERGIPKKYAPRLLLDWDIAYDNGNNYVTQLFNKTVAVCSEFRGIPWHRAISLATLDLSYETRQDESVRELAALIRRYKPWEGTENLIAFRRRAEYLKLPVPAEKTEPKYVVQSTRISNHEDLVD